jgi:aryl-alcohol dehydrogenase-like predicted oxidoreductase
MRFRALGKTGLEVSELALGTWGLSGDGYGPIAAADQDAVIDRALALGITLFETADVYGRGEMERKLGERLRERPEARIVTKVGTDRSGSPIIKRFDPAFLRTAFDASRTRLARDVVDVVLLHNPVAKTVADGAATGVLAELKAEGKIRAWGVSAGSLEVAKASIARGADVVSMTYNVMYSADVKSIHDEIAKCGVGLLAHSVLAHGLLCGYWSLHKEFPSGDHRTDRWTPDELRRRISQLPALRSVVGGIVFTMRSAALRYVLANLDVSSAVLGPRSILQLDALVREASKELPYLSEDQLRSLAFRLEQAGVNT